MFRRYPEVRTSLADVAVVRDEERGIEFRPIKFGFEHLTLFRVRMPKGEFTFQAVYEYPVDDGVVTTTWHVSGLPDNAGPLARQCGFKDGYEMLESAFHVYGSIGTPPIPVSQITFFGK